jgi:hypothetical protein
MVDGLAGELVTLMRQRYLVGTKLLETFSRGLFVLVCIYLLPLEEAGRFGLLATIIGLLSFCLGFERQIDVQRQIAGRSSSAIRRRLGDTLRFFRTHYLLVLPLSMLVATLAGVPAWMLGLATTVVIGEHISNQGYQAVLLSHRAFPLLVASATKSTLQLLAVTYFSWKEPDAFTMLAILEVWAVASVIYLGVAGFWWLSWTREPLPLQGDELPVQGFFLQYQASSFHFLIGAIAVAALQIDRLLISGLLGPSDTGLYFRHVTLMSLAFQVFNIASFNRVAPGIYQQARQKAWKRCAQVVRTEYARFALLFSGAVALALLADHALGHPSRRLGLEASFLLIITAAVLLRTAADYKGLLLLSLGGDRALFRNQACAVVLGGAGLFLLSWAYSLPGAFIGAVLMPMLYFLFNSLSVRGRYSQLDLSSP